MAGKPVEAKGNGRPGRDNGERKERSGENRRAGDEDHRLQNQRMLFDCVHASKNAPVVRRGQARVIFTSRLLNHRITQEWARITLTARPRSSCSTPASLG